MTLHLFLGIEKAVQSFCHIETMISVTRVFDFVGKVLSYVCKE